MPQLEQIAATYGSQLFWLLLTFGLVYLIVGRGMVPRVQQTVDGRDRRIADDLAAAEAARARADALEEEHRARQDAARAEAMRASQDAKAAAARATEARVREADVGIQASTDEAERRLAAARTSALAEVEAVAAEAARDMVQRLAGVSVSDDDARRAVREATVRG